jgi:hypothetical protein
MENENLQARHRTTLKLANAIDELRDAELHVKQAVRACREAEISWTVIGAQFGISKQAAQQRFGSEVE